MTMFRIGDDFVADLDHIVAMYIPDNRIDGPWLVIAIDGCGVWKRMPRDEAAIAIKAFYEAKGKHEWPDSPAALSAT